jgi:hypothetical protein
MRKASKQEVLAAAKQMLDPVLEEKLQEWRNENQELRAESRALRVQVLESVLSVTKLSRKLSQSEARNKDAVNRVLQRLADLENRL